MGFVPELVVFVSPCIPGPWAMRGASGGFEPLLIHELELGSYNETVR